MSKVAFYTLGCKLNYSETSTISRTFEERGYIKVDFEEQPDVIVINTCTVTNNADKKCRKIIRDARKSSKDPFIVVVGCYAQLKPEEISSIPGVDAVLGANEKFRLHQLLNDFEKKEKPQVYTSDISSCESFHGAYSLNSRTRTFLKIQDGCDYPCTYCTIPIARGPSRSDTIDHVVKSAREIAANGVKEIVLTGINTGDFGIRNGKRAEHFIDLLYALNTEVPEIQRYRISSIEPNLLTDEIISFVASNNKFVPHFHIPLQSGCDKILKSMRRRYSRDLFSNRVQTIKEEIPQCCIGADIITGFPGETDEDFKTTYRFVNELDLSYLHVFTFSERENTPAIKMEQSVKNKTRNERSKMLRMLSEKKKHFFYKQFLGQTMKVLFEKDIENGLMHGFTDNYIRVSAPHDPKLVNQLANIKLREIDNNGNLTGTIE